jgi:hypothetical protein
MKRLLFVGLCIVAQVCSATTETNSVFGIPLNERLKMPECHGTELHEGGNYRTAVTDVCYETDKDSVGTGSNSGRTFLKVRFPKFLPIVKDSVVSVAIDGNIQDGKVGAVYFRTWGMAAAGNIFIALKQKYGAPSHVNSKTLKNKAGDSIQAYDAEWIDDTVVVVFHSITSSLEEGEVSVFTPQAWEDAKKRNAIR